MTSSVKQALSPWDIYDAVNFQPHAGQIPILRSNARNRVVAAGRRFGKSQIGGHELVPEAFLTYARQEELRAVSKRREFWIVGPEYSDSEKEFRVAYDKLKRLEVPFDKPGTYNNPESGYMHISLWGGLYQVHAMSAKYPDSLVGEGLSGVIMAEAAKMKESVWTKYVRPTLADFRGWSLFSSTPEGKNWFYNLYTVGQDPARTEWESWRRPAWMNYYVYPGGELDSEIVEMRADMSSELFNQEIAADFTEFVGRVFKDFDEEVHVNDCEYNPAWETYAAVDYGYTNPFVWLLIQVGPWGEINVLDEYYERGKTIPEIAADLESRHLIPDGLIRFYPDPASPGSSVELSELIRKPYAGGTGGLLSDRIESIRKALKINNDHLDWGHPDRQPTLHVNRRCKNFIREFLDYRYPKSEEEAALSGETIPENPMKKDDHTPEALGRFFAGHFASRGVEVQTTRITQATMSRRRRV